MQIILYTLVVLMTLIILSTLSLFVLYNIGGWQLLELRFRTSKNIRSHTHFSRIILGKIPYSKSVKIVLNNDGIYIKPNRILLFHKPLFIYWADIDYVIPPTQGNAMYFYLKLDTCNFLVGIEQAYWSEIQKLNITTLKSKKPLVVDN